MRLSLFKSLPFLPQAIHRRWGFRMLLPGKGQQSGRVYLVGAGPGDAELLTLKAWRLLQQADLVLYDDLVSDELLAMLPAKLDKRYVGKRCGVHSLSQQQICRLLVTEAQAGKCVVRLKGGDPAVFARSAEECAALENAGIAFAIVPGITAASGLSAWCGIPLTHRDCAQSVRFITARMKCPQSEPNWASLVLGSKEGETLVFYMGLNRLDLICQRLAGHGMAADMPVAVVENVSQLNQQRVTGQLGDITAKVAARQFQGPALIVVGKVVSHRVKVSPALLDQAAALSGNRGY